VEISSADQISDKLYIEHVSDIVGVYINGHYLTTVAPLGTEIDTKSFNPNYRFGSVGEHLQVGTNTLAFRTEIWGHGSFMFPRGKLLGSQGQLPAIGFDSEKGLYGNAHLGNLPLANWAVRAHTGGQLQGYAAPEHPDSSWAPTTLPNSLDKGDMRWYRATFDAADLPDPEQMLAPVVLTLKGSRAKATIYVNGRLIGRWLSDANWLSRGSWARATRDMWMNTSADDFPVNIGLLNPPGQPNTLASLFEDASGDRDQAGRIDELRFNYAKENAGESAFKGKAVLELN
jgi:hypothetical protein